MDEAEQDQHETRLKEMFHSFDATGTGSLCQQELIDLCQLLNLEEVTPALQKTLFQDNLLGRVYFDQFKEALILVLSRTLSFEEHLKEPDCLPEVQPKYIKDGKCYGRRSLPEFQELLGEFAEVKVLESLNEEAQSSLTTASDYNEYHKTQHSEEYEAEGQLRFWNPDDSNASQRGSSPTQDWIDDKLHQVCKDLGISQDGHLNKKKLISICEQYDLKNVNKEIFEDIFHDLKPDDTMNLKDFFYGLFKNGKPLTTSASTPYRQLKRQLSMQSFDESGRRTMTSSAITSSITFRLFSCLDDGMGYGSVEQILDTWNEEGIENGQEILKALDFSLDGSINLMELTLALENELLITKNGMHQAALASFKTEIRHLSEQIDQVTREKEKLQSDLEKAEKLKSLMASEVDDHHASIERQYEYNLRKLEEVYKEKIASFKNDIQKEREQILQQVGKQHLELEQEIEKMKTEENYIRDRLTFSLKENSRLESELLENTEKLAEYESLITKLQKNLDNILAEKFHDLDPNSAEFLLQEERLTRMKTEYEHQCRMLQDQVDELQSELEEYRAQGKVFKLPFKKSLSEEFDVRHHSTDLDQGFGSENYNPLNMSIEAELIIEQLKEQHHRDMKCLTLELEDKMIHYEKQLDETKANCEKEQENVKQKYKNEMHALEKQLSALKTEIAELQKQTVALKKEQQTDCRYIKEKNELQMKFNEEKAHLQEKLKLEHEAALKNRLQQVEESFNREREGLIQNGTWAEEKMRDLVKAKEEEKHKLEEFYQEQLKSLMEKHALEKEELQKKLLEKHQNKLQEERNKMEIEYNRRNSHIEAHFLNECQKVPSKYEDFLINLKDSYQQELKDLMEQQYEEKSKWEFEKDELIQECAEAQEQLKQTLKHEKANFLALTRQQEILEKKYKEHLISLVAEKQQLQKDLEELRNVAESQQNQMFKQIFEPKNSHEKGFKDGERFTSQVDETGKLDRQKLKEQEIKCEYEKEDIASQFLTMEDFNKKTCEKADREKVELSLEIPRLQNKIKELQHGILTKPQSSYQVETSENADMASEMSLVQQGTQLLEENGDILINLQRAHERAVKENVKMAAEIIKLHQRLQKLDPESVTLASLEESNDDLFRTSLEQIEILSSQNRIKQGEGIVTHSLCESLDDNVQESERTEISSFQTLETKTQESLGSLEGFSELENNEVTSTESLDLKNKFPHLQDRLKVLHTESDQASDNKQDLIFDVSILKKKVKVLENNPEAIAKYRMLYEDANRENCCLQEELKMMEAQYNKEMENNRDLTSEVFRLQTELKKVETVTKAFLRIKQSYGEVKIENEDLKTLVLRLEDKIEKLQERSVEQYECFSLSEVGLDTQELEAEKKILEQNKRLERWDEKLMNVKSVLKECNQENLTCGQEDTWPLDKIKVSEDFWLQGKMNPEENSTRQTQLKKTEENAVFSDLQGKFHCNDTRIAELELEKNKLQELTRQLREKVTNLAKQKHLPTRGEKEEELKSMMHDLQNTCSEMQHKVELLRQESEKFQEENSILGKEFTTLNGEGSISYLKLRELRGSQEEIWKKIETVNKEKITIQKMVENFKKQVSELKARNQHLDLENAELLQKNTENEADLQYLHQHLAQILCHKEKEIGNCTLEEWGKQSSKLKEELDNCTAKSSDVVSSLEAELSKIKIQTHAVEQENFFLKDELERMKQLAKLNFLENKIATMKLQQKSWEDQSEILKSQLAASQEKVQNLGHCLQNANTQMSQMKSDLQMTQQENEALKEEVMSLHKQLQNVSGKNWLPELAICPSGLQNRQKLMSWNKLGHLINQEQQLLMQEDARLQIVVQSSTAELIHSQEKVSQMNKLEEELETIHLENQSLKNKQVKVDEEMMEGSQKQLVMAMEERMIEVEQKLKLVKRLLQEKVNQLKEQLCKNTKSEAVMKDLYVENTHLLKTLEITEQQQKTAEKKNYLLEEKIASLSNIIRNLTPAPMISAPPLRS